MIWFLLLATLYLLNLPPVFKERQRVREHAGSINTHVRLAGQLLKGRIDFDELFYKDIAIFEDRYYSPFPPLPALVLVPAVALFGQGLLTTLVSPLLGGLAAWILFRLLTGVGASRQASLWTTAGCILGSVYLCVLRDSYETYFAQALAFPLALASLYFAWVRPNGFAAGACLGAACLCRQLSAMLAPFLALMLWMGPNTETRPVSFRLRQVLFAGIALAAALAALLGYNWMRFGNFFDSGYAYILEPGWYGSRMEKWGIFNLAYLPSNAIRMFLAGFTVEFLDSDHMIPSMSPFGTSLTVASPFLFYAFWGGVPARRVATLVGWACIGACLLVVLMNKNANGAVHMNGQRYALDFLPLLAVFAALGMDRVRQAPWAQLWKPAALYSVALNVLALAIHYGGKFLALVHATGLDRGN